MKNMKREHYNRPDDVRDSKGDVQFDGLLSFEESVGHLSLAQPGLGPLRHLSQHSRALVKHSLTLRAMLVAWATQSAVND